MDKTVAARPASHQQNGCIALENYEKPVLPELRIAYLNKRFALSPRGLRGSRHVPAAPSARMERFVYGSGSRKPRQPALTPTPLTAPERLIVPQTRP